MANPTPKASSTRAQLPVGPSGAEPPNAPEGALAYANDTELVRVKTSTGWEDVGSGGGGGSITSIVEGPGIDITGGTGPVVTVSVDPSEISLVGDANGPLDANQVNAIHETSGPTKLTIGNINDFQLLQRVGATVVGTAYPPTTLVGDVNGSLISNQVNAIHETSGPTQLTIGAISAGQVLQRVGNTVVGVAGGLPTGNPYIDPPAVANSFDDEFETGSADLATRGWTVKNSAGTTLTRSGDVDAWNATGPAAGTYWSTLRGSQLIVQFPAIASTYSIFKPITLATGDIYFARAGSATRLDSSAPSGAFEVGLYANAAGIPDGGNRVYVSSYGGTNGAWYIDLFRATAGAFAGTTKQPLGAALPDIRGVQYVSPSTYRPFMTNSANGDTFSVQPTGAIAGSTVAYAAIQWAPDITYAGSIPYVISIDFFRKVTFGQGIAQNPRPVLWNVVNGDIGVYSPKTTPVLADQVYVADSSASNAIRRSSLREVAVAGGTMYEAYPTTTDSWSDEFDEGSSDPTVRGWSVVQIYPSIAAMTRLGDVDANINPPVAMAAGQYRSTVRNGQLYLQVGGNSGNILYVYKASTGAFAFASLVSATVYAANSHQAVHITSTVASAYGAAGANSSTLERSGASGVTASFYKHQGTTFTSFSTLTLNDPFRTLALHLDWTGSTLTGSLTSLGDGPLQLYAAGQTPPAAWVPAFAGIMARCNNATAGRNWVTVDYIRRYPSGTYFPV